MEDPVLASYGALNGSVLDKDPGTAEQPIKPFAREACLTHPIVGRVDGVVLCRPKIRAFQNSAVENRCTKVTILEDRTAKIGGG